MTNLRILNDASEKCNDAILITGMARSGTTILGKLLHSLLGVEYIFEPPLLFSHIPKISDMSKNDWCLLYETYLYEDQLLGILGGRSINCNEIDDSSIYKVKSKLDIDKRLLSTHRKSELIEIARSSDVKLAYKMPDIFPFVPELLQYYPDMHVINMYRNPVDVLNSIIQKEWFTDNSIKNGGIIWPNYDVGGMYVPFWVKKDNIEGWLEMDEFSRAGYYIERMLLPIREIESPFIIDYDSLVSSPKEILSTIKEKLNLKDGNKTKDIVDSIKYQEKPRDKKILNRLSQEQKLRITDLVDEYECHFRK